MLLSLEILVKIARSSTYSRVLKLSSLVLASVWRCKEGQDVLGAAVGLGGMKSAATGVRVT